MIFRFSYWRTRLFEEQQTRFYQGTQKFYTNCIHHRKLYKHIWKSLRTHWFFYLCLYCSSKHLKGKTNLNTFESHGSSVFFLMCVTDTKIKRLTSSFKVQVCNQVFSVVKVASNGKNWNFFTTYLIVFHFDVQFACLEYCFSIKLWAYSRLHQV